MRHEKYLQVNLTHVYSQSAVIDILPDAEASALHHTLSALCAGNIKTWMIFTHFCLDSGCFLYISSSSVFLSLHYHLCSLPLSLQARWVCVCVCMFLCTRGPLYLYLCCVLSPSVPKSHRFKHIFELLFASMWFCANMSVCVIEREKAWRMYNGDSRPRHLSNN